MILRGAAAGFALLFALSVALQWNDPDPVPWMVLYGLAAASSARAAAGRAPGRLGLAVSIVLGLAFAAWSPALSHLSPAALQSFGMSGAPAEEEAREALGLGLAFGWTAFLTARGERQRPQADPSARRPTA